MIVVVIEKLSNGDTSHVFGGIACDVEGCPVIENNNGGDRKNLIQEGWFIEPGRHRCPAHFHTDVPGRGTERREIDRVSKRI